MFTIKYITKYFIRVMAFGPILISGCLENNKISNPEDHQISLKTGNPLPFSESVEWYRDVDIGGEAELVKSELFESEGRIGKRIHIQVPEEGDYYLNAWADGLSGKMLEVRVDGFLIKQKLKFSQDGWGSTSLWEKGIESLPVKAKESAKKIGLSAGPHEISFFGEEDAWSAVDFIRLGKSAKSAEISNAEYNQYISDLIKSSKAEVKGSAALEKSVVAMDDPRITYGYRDHQFFTYTWYKTYALTAGNTYTFETRNPSPSSCDPVLYLYNASYPETYSWRNDDYNGLMSRIRIQAPVSGNYHLQLEA